MPIVTQNAPIKLMCADPKIAKMYCEGHVIYSSGNVVTYHVDSGVSYQEEVDEGASCLSPTSFVPTKSGWTFAGWRQDTDADGAALSSLPMGDEPIALYAVFTQTVTLSTVANGVTSSQSKNRIYNNGNITNPSFSVSNPSKSGAAFKGWSSSSSSTGIANASISNMQLSASTTRWAVFAYNNAGPYTAGEKALSPEEHQGSNPHEGIIYSSINTAIYGAVQITASNNTSINIKTDGAGYRSIRVYYKVGSNQYTVGARYRDDNNNLSGDASWNNKTITMTLSSQGTQPLYLGAVVSGNGFARGSAYMSSATIVLIGRTVVG